MKAVKRDDVLRRYYRWRELCLEHHTAALDHISRSAILENARRLGMAEGQTVVAGCEEEMNLIVDLALYTSRPGRSRALDRYARSCRLPPASPTAVMLAAMQRARFSVWLVKQDHEVAGIVVEDCVTKQQAWLVDVGLEASAPPGLLFAARVCQPDVFSMTNGVTIPLGRALLDELVETSAGRDLDAERIANNPRFITALYRAVVRLGMLDSEGEALDDQLLDITLGAASSQRARTLVPGL
jgi:hypothetical protein